MRTETELLNENDFLRRELAGLRVYAAQLYSSTISIPVPDDGRTRVRWVEYVHFPFSERESMELEQLFISYEGLIVSSHKNFWGSTILIVNTGMELRTVRLSRVTICNA